VTCRLLLAGLALVVGLAAFPATAHADELPDEVLDAWDREDQDSTRPTGWRRGAYGVLGTHMRIWGVGAQIVPLALASTLLGVGVGLFASNVAITGYVLAYIGLPMAVSTVFGASAMWPTFELIRFIISSSRSSSRAIGKLLATARATAWTALALAIVATIAAVLAFPTDGVTGIIAVGAAIPLPYLAFAAIAENAIGQQLLRRRRDRYGRFREPSLSVGVGSLIIRF
jgi:hypothetical protein